MHANTTTSIDTTKRFSRRFFPLFAVGLPGIATLPFAFLPTLQAQPLPPEAPPLWVLALLSLIQPALLLALGAALGAGLAWRLGLRSHLLGRFTAGAPLWPALRREFVPALWAAVGVVAAMLLLDVLVFKPMLPEFFARAQSLQPRTWATTVAGILYGGFTEEVIARWGIMSLLIWLGWRALQGGRGTPAPALCWVAIVLNALLFGISHLPATLGIAPLSPGLLARILLLNGLAGMVFGWQFWKRSLETAMLAHAGVHVALSLAALAGLA